MRLKAPEGVTQFQASSGMAYPVEDGHIEVENASHAAEAMHHTHGFKPAPAAPTPPAPKSGTGTEADDPFVGMTKDDLRDWLDERDVDYPNRASKDDLLALARAYTPAE